MLAIINVSPEDAHIYEYEVRVNGEVMATFTTEKKYTSAAQCLRDAADAVVLRDAPTQDVLLRSLDPLFDRWSHL